MAKHAKYVELTLKEEGMPSHLLAGYEIVSDYRSEGKRRLFLRRPEQAEAMESKPKQVRKRKAKGNSSAAVTHAHNTPLDRVPDTGLDRGGISG